MTHKTKNPLLFPTLMGSVLTLAPVSQILAAAYTFTPFEIPNDTATLVQGINDNGQIIGYYVDATGYHGFVFNSGSFTSLDAPSAAQGQYGGTFAKGINASGQIVGDYIDSTGSGHGFLYNNGMYSTIDYPNATSGLYIGSYLSGINNSGQISGNFYDDAHNLHGFLYSSGTYSLFDNPNAPLGADFGTPSGGGSNPQSLNDNGLIIGNFWDTDFHTHGYLYEAGVFTTLDVPNATPGVLSFFRGINANGQIVSDYSDATGIHGFIYADGVFSTISDPNAPLIPHTLTYPNSDNSLTTVVTGYSLFTSLTGINTNGQIVGYSLSNFGDLNNPDIFQSFIATPTSVPILNTSWLFLSALFGYLGLRHRK